MRENIAPGPCLPKSPVELDGMRMDIVSWRRGSDSKGGLRSAVADTGGRPRPRPEAAAAETKPTAALCGGMEAPMLGCGCCSRNPGERDRREDWETGERQELPRD